MTDKRFQKLINDCRSLFEKHQKLLAKAESEYQRRYGSLPSDLEDDWWIDAMHYGNGDSSLEKIAASAELAVKRRKAN